MVAPYLDMGGHQPANLYRAITAAHLHDFSAGFVIGDGCTPTWDDGVPIANDRAVSHVITKAEGLGGHMIVSFGGAGGKDLARSCSNPGELLAAYEAVVKRLHATYLDFDIEGASLAEPTSIARRFEAIAALEAVYPRLVVSLTVPVMPHGLDAQCRHLLAAAKTDGVRVDLLNIMTMDYGGGSIDMGSAAVSAAKATLVQMRKFWPQSTYQNLGITPMIGTNDDVRETFTRADARHLVGFARRHHVGRLAFWALGRDQKCAQPHRKPQDDCSDLAAPRLAFTRAFLS
jgi:chitinase